MTKYKEKVFNYTYKIVNLINNKYYYGCHSTDDAFGDNYMGGGTYLHKSYNKYGIESFEKEMLENFKTRKEMLEAEKRLITKEMINDINCYNLKLGGEGGSVKGRIVKEKSKMKHSNTIKGRNSTNCHYMKNRLITMAGRDKTTHNSYVRQSISASKGVYITPYGNFYSITDAGKVLNVSGQTIKNWCRVMNDKLIVKNPKTCSAILSIKNAFTKTYKEAGFSFIKFPKNCLEINERIKFCKDRNINFEFDKLTTDNNVVKIMKRDLGVFITPLGNFSTAYKAALHLKTKTHNIIRYCITEKNDLSNFHKNSAFYNKFDIKDKTYFDLGFDYIKADRDCENIKEFYINNGVQIWTI